MEFYRRGAPAGADIEIATEIAGRMGLTAEFIDEPVVGIIDALIENRCDAIINAFTDNAERRARVSFIDYLKVGQTVVVPAGNPKDVNGMEDLAELQVLVQADTSNEVSLRQIDAANQAAGLSPMWIAAYKGTTAETVSRAAAALRSGTGDADFLDVINARWAARDPRVQVAPFTVNAEPYGIAVRHEDTELGEAIADAVRRMYQEGAMSEILGRWSLDDVALSSSDEVLLRHR